MMRLYFFRLLVILVGCLLFGCIEDNQSNIELDSLDYLFTVSIGGEAYQVEGAEFFNFQDGIRVSCNIRESNTSPVVGSFAIGRIDGVFNNYRLDSLRNSNTSTDPFGWYFVLDNDLVRQHYMVTPPYSFINVEEISDSRVTITFDSLLFTKTRPDSPGQSFVDSFYMTNGRMEAGPAE